MTTEERASWHSFTTGDDETPVVSVKEQGDVFAFAVVVEAIGRVQLPVGSPVEVEHYDDGGEVTSSLCYTTKFAYANGWDEFARNAAAGVWRERTAWLQELADEFRTFDS